MPSQRRLQRFSQPSYRQRRAAEAIEKAATDFDIAITTHVRDSEVAYEARCAVRALAERLKAEILSEDI